MTTKRMSRHATRIPARGRIQPAGSNTPNDPEIAGGYTFVAPDADGNRAARRAAARQRTQRTNCTHCPEGAPPMIEPTTTGDQPGPEHDAPHGTEES